MLHEAQPAIDLTRHAFKRELGDIAIFGTWLWNNDQEDTEPCLVLIPRYRTMDFKPAVIALSAAFRYNDPRYLARASAVFSTKMGFDDMVTAHKVATLIYDHLGDLISMPPDPTIATVIGEASVKLGDGRTRTVEVLDYEQERG